MSVILASGSPRRQELLRLIYPEFTVLKPDCDENIAEVSAPEQLPEKLAVKKLLCVKEKSVNSNDTIIAADTAVIIDNICLGKPENEGAAENMLRSLSGRTHKVVTGVAVSANGRTLSFSETTEVTFYALDSKEIEEYIATGEPFDKAGAYGIQGRGGLFVREIRGDYFNVVGLPVGRLARTLRKLTSI